MSTAASETTGALRWANILSSLIGRNEEKAGNGCDVVDHFELLLQTSGLVQEKS